MEDSITLEIHTITKDTRPRSIKEILRELKTEEICFLTSEEAVTLANSDHIIPALHYHSHEVNLCDLNYQTVRLSGFLDDQIEFCDENGEGFIDFEVDELAYISFDGDTITFTFESGEQWIAGYL